MRYAIIAYDHLFECKHKQYVVTVVEVESEYAAVNKGFEISYDFIINNSKISKELLSRAQETAYSAGIEEELKKYPLKSHTSFDELLKSHSRKFKSYMDRVDFQLYGNDKSELPIDERLNGIRNGEEDITLPVLYFNYGRYLLLSSSFKSKLPSNLQGIWNIKLKPEWNCDFHFDINLQMYYYNKYMYKYHPQ